MPRSAPDDFGARLKALRDPAVEELGLRLRELAEYALGANQLVRLAKLVGESLAVKLTSWVGSKRTGANP